MKNLLILLMVCACTVSHAQNDDKIFLKDSRVISTGVMFQDSTNIYFKQGNVYFKTPLANVQQMNLTVDYYKWWDYNTSMSEAWRLQREGSNKYLIGYGFLIGGSVIALLSSGDSYVFPTILFAVGGGISLYGFFQSHKGNRIARDASIRMSARPY